MRGLDGKVAIVPSGCTKIGRAVVDAYVAAGTKVMVADIAEGGGSAEGVAFQTCDLRDDAQIAALVQTTKDRFGRIDFLVNVACSYLDNGAASTRAEWLESLNVNVVGSVMLIQAAEVKLARNRGGDRQLRFDLVARGADGAPTIPGVEGGNTAMGPEQAVPAIPLLMS